MERGPGDVIADRYEIIEPLSAGGMGAVYRARNWHLEGLIVALKEMLPHFPSGLDRQAIHERFTREAIMLSQLRHDGIPRVMDHFIQGDSHLPPSC